MSETSSQANAADKAPQAVTSVGDPQLQNGDEEEEEESEEEEEEEEETEEEEVEDEEGDKAGEETAGEIRIF